MIPAPGQEVYLKSMANLSTGGSAIDVTDFVHADLRFYCERAAGVCGLDVCGVDLIA
jgi:cyanophycin synthetase